MGPIKIRGIYATALVALLKDFNFKLTQPSEAIADRFKELCTINEPPSATIIDRRDKQGVIVRGASDVAEEVARIIRYKVPSAIIRKSWINPHSIFKGVVLKKENDKCLVDIGCGVGVLRGVSARQNDEIVVEAAKPVFGKERPVLSRKIRVSGKYAHILLGGWVSVSRFVKDKVRREELFTLGKMVKTERWGVKWRSSSESASASELIAEVKSLIKMGEELLRRAESTRPPALLKMGDPFFDVEFPRTAKAELDRVRREVKPTIAGHHYLRSCGGASSQLVDFAESMLSLGVDEQIIQRALKSTWQPRALREGALLNIEHSTLNGTTHSLTPGVVVSVQDDFIEVRRDFRSEGKFDGLNIPKSRGDYSIMAFKLGGWVTLNAYYSQRNELKGYYVNVNTPIEVYRYRIRYVDLGIDVVKRANAPASIVDVAALEEAHVEGKVSPEIYDKALNIAALAKDLLDSCDSLNDLKIQLLSSAGYE